MNSNLFKKGITEIYPEYLLENRCNIEATVIACIYKKIYTIQEYKLKKEMFFSKDGTFYFQLAKKLLDSGIKTIDELSIISTFNEDVIEKFESKGGYQTIEDMVSTVKEENIDAALELLYKSNIICNLHKDGFNLVTPVNIDGKMIKPLDLFKMMDSATIINWYSSMLSKYEIGTSINVLEDEIIDFDENFFDEANEDEGMGIEYATCGYSVDGEIVSVYPFISNKTLGFNKTTLNMIGAFGSTGKSTFIIGIIASLIRQGHSVIIISNEENSFKYKAKLATWLMLKVFGHSKLTRTKINKKQIDDESIIVYEEFMKYWDKYFKDKLRVVRIKDANMQLVDKYIRDAAINEGRDVFIYETFKLQIEDMTQARQDLALVRDSRNLESLAKQYDMIGIATIQLKDSDKGRLWLDNDSLSNSKQIKENLETLLLMRNVYDDELDPENKLYCYPFRVVKDEATGKWKEEEYIPDRTKVWRALFVDKTRSGSNSNDTGTGFLLEFDGEHAVFKEKAQARFRHAHIGGKF